MRSQPSDDPLTTGAVLGVSLGNGTGSFSEAALLIGSGSTPGLTLTSHMLEEQKFQQLHALSPLGRSSTAEDVAATVKFALENRSITGTTLLVDGGQHLMKFERDFSMM